MIRAVVIAAGILAGGLANAQQSVAQQAYRFEITPVAGYRVGGTFEDELSETELDLDDGGSYGLVLNLRESPNTEWEIGYSHQETSIDTADIATGIGDLDLDVDYLQFGGTYIGPSNVARPFLVATVGLARFDPDDSALDSETYFAFSIGGGVKLWPARRFGLRLEGRFYGTVLDSESKIFCVSEGGAGTCLISTKAEVLWQWEMMLGAIMRF